MRGFFLKGVGLGALALTLALAGCAAPDRGASGGEASSPAAVVTEVPTPEVTLFDSLLTPLAQGRLSGKLEKVKAEAASRGFSCIEENGVLLIQDPSDPASYLRCELSYATVDPRVSALVYSRSLGEVERQVRITGIGTQTPAYFTGVTAYGQENQVPSLEETAAYLTAELTPEETAVPDPETALGLFDNILVPLAQGGIPNRAEDFKAALEARGYIYQATDEGTLVVYDPVHPECHLFCDAPLLEAADTLPSLVFHLGAEEGGREVEVSLLDGTKYYVNDSLGNRTEVKSLDILREHLCQK